MPQCINIYIICLVVRHRAGKYPAYIGKLRYTLYTPVDNLFMTPVKLKIKSTCKERVYRVNKENGWSPNRRFGTISIQKCAFKGVSHGSWIEVSVIKSCSHFSRFLLRLPERLWEPTSSSLSCSVSVVMVSRCCLDTYPVTVTVIIVSVGVPVRLDPAHFTLTLVSVDSWDNDAALSTV